MRSRFPPPFFPFLFSSTFFPCSFRFFLDSFSSSLVYISLCQFLIILFKVTKGCFSHCRKEYHLLYLLSWFTWTPSSQTVTLGNVYSIKNQQYKIPRISPLPPPRGNGNYNHTTRLIVSESAWGPQFDRITSSGSSKKSSKERAHLISGVMIFQREGAITEKALPPDPFRYTA